MGCLLACVIRYAVVWDGGRAWVTLDESVVTISTLTSNTIIIYLQGQTILTLPLKKILQEKLSNTFPRYSTKTRCLGNCKESYRGKELKASVFERSMKMHFPLFTGVIEFGRIPFGYLAVYNIKFLHVIINQVCFYKHEIPSRRICTRTFYLWFELLESSKLKCQ